MKSSIFRFISKFEISKHESYCQNIHWEKIIKIFTFSLLIVYSVLIITLNNNIYPIYFLGTIYLATISKIQRPNLNIFFLSAPFILLGYNYWNVNHYSLLIGCAVIYNIGNFNYKIEKFILVLSLAIILYLKSVAAGLAIVLVYFKIPVKYVVLVIFFIYALIFTGFVDQPRKEIYVNTFNITKESFYLGNPVPFIEYYNYFLEKKLTLKKFDVSNDEIFNSKTVGFLSNPVNDLLYLLYEGGLTACIIFLLILFLAFEKLKLENMQLLSYFIIISFFNFSFYKPEIFVILFSFSLLKQHDKYKY